MARQMKKRFAVGGALLGLAWGFYTQIMAYVASPGVPGPAELMVQVVILGVLGVCGAVAGFVAGVLADLISRKRG
jgi:Zn-dependent protease with chaperone function